MSTISTHVLDTSIGKPAAGIRVTLERLSGRDGAVEQAGSGVTDQDGRLRNLLAPDVRLDEGTYRLRFDVEAYFVRQGREAFFPEVIVVFRVGRGDDHHYHVPVLLSPFGYSTYRGS